MGERGRVETERGSDVRAGTFHERHQTGGQPFLPGVEIDDEVGRPDLPEPQQREPV